MSDLNSARGSITIDTSQLDAARASVQAFATGATASLTGINSAATSAQTSLTGLSSVARQFAGAFGVSLGAAGIVQLGKAAIASDQLVISFNRQMVAAKGLAGSQAQLNQLLEVYDKATGGILDKSTELANVTKLMAVGFADSSQELEKFATSIRGISMAMGVSQDFVTQNLILEMFSQRGQRLDQLGLEYDKVRAKADELQRSDSTLTQKMAYQAAVLEEAQRKFGDLAKSTVGARSGIEAVATEWNNLRLEIAQEFHPGFDKLAQDTGNFLSWIRQRRASIGGEADNLFRGAGIGVAPFGQAARDIGRHSSGSGGGSGGGITGPTGEQLSAMVDWERKRTDIARQAINDINEEETSFGRQRADTIANYNKDISRGAEDFARQQTQAEQNLQDSIADVQADGARRQLQMAVDLQRTIAAAQRDSADRLADLQENLDRTLGERRADSADRIAEMEDDRDKSIAEKKADSAKRILEIEENYNEQRIRSEAQYHLNRTQAAERLDGRALFDLEAQHKIESQQALDSKDKQIADEKSKLDEALRKVNESYAERLGDEQKALAKSIKQANDAHNRQVDDEKKALQKRIDNANAAYGIQLADGIAADNQRIQDLKDAYDAEKTQANNEYGLRLTRQEQDHNDQLKAMGDAHDLRIKQIGTHAAAERAAIDEEFKATLTALGLHVGNYITEQDRIEKAAEKSWGDFMKTVQGTLDKAIGPVANPKVPLPSMNQGQIDALEDDKKKTQDALKGLAVGSPEFNRLTQHLNDIDTQLAILKGGTGGIPTGPAFNMPKASAFAPMPAMASGAMMGGSNRSLSVGDINVTVNAVSGDTANSIMDVIDKRILHQIQVAAGRL